MVIVVVSDIFFGMCGRYFEDKLFEHFMKILCYRNIKVYEWTYDTGHIRPRLHCFN